MDADDDVLVVDDVVVFVLAVFEVGNVGDVLSSSLLTDNVFTVPTFVLPGTDTLLDRLRLFVLCVVLDHFSCRLMLFEILFFDLTGVDVVVVPDDIDEVVTDDALVLVLR